jgi:4-methyl-5(b-hydroxyethyl)-thiazole monophosphate biosynthesis
MSEHRILVPLATGFEETEAIAIIDVLRRAELEVVTAAIGPQQVVGAHGISVLADLTWEDLDETGITAMVLPGGMPGTTNLRDDSRVIALLQRLAGEGQLTAAICAAPLVLGAAGLLGEGREYTCYPGMAADLAQWGPRSEARVVASGTILTSQGPATAIEFGLAVVEALAGAATAQEVAEGMLVPSAN